MGTRDARPDLSELTHALYDDRARVRGEAAEALARIGPEAFEALFDVADGNVTKVVRDVEAALRGMRDASVLNGLLAKLADEDGSLRECAAKLLGAFRDQRVVAALVDVLERDDDDSVRAAAVVSLERIGRADCIPPLAHALGDGDEVVRSAAAAALVRVGRPAMEAVRSTLEEGNARARYRAATVLVDGDLVEERTIAPLLAALGDEAAGVRHMAALALGKCRASHAVAPLLELLRDSDASVRLAAAESLERGVVAAQTQGRELAPAADARKQALAELLVDLEGKELQRSHDAALVLGWCGGDDAVEPLVGVLADHHKSDVHGPAVEALGRIGNERCLDVLVEIVGSRGGWELRRDAVRALGGMQDARASAAVIEALHDEDDLVADAAWVVAERRGVLPPEEPAPPDEPDNGAAARQPDVVDADESVRREQPGRQRRPSPADAPMRPPPLPVIIVGLAAIGAATWQLHTWKTSLTFSLEAWYFWIGVAFMSAVGVSIVLSLVLAAREGCARWGRSAQPARRPAAVAWLGSFAFGAALLWLLDWRIGVGIVDACHALSRRYFESNPYADPVMISAHAVEASALVLCIYSAVAWLRSIAVGAEDRTARSERPAVLPQVLLLGIGVVCLAGFVANVRRQIERESLVPRLRTGSAAERAAAVDAIGELGLCRAFDELVTMLADPDPVLREKAVRALGALEDKDAVEPLAARLMDDVPAVRDAAVAAIESLGRPVARELLAQGEEREAGDVWPVPEACESLLRSLRHEDPDVRIASVRLLTELRDRRALEGVIALLEDARERVRVCAVRALGEFGDPCATEPLVAALARGGVRYGRATREIPSALVHIGDPRAAALLYPLLVHADQNTRDLAMQALAGLPLDAAEAVPPLVQAMADSHLRAAAAEALVTVGESAVEPLIARLDDSSTRAAAVDALGAIGDPRAAPALVRLLPTGGVVEALAKLGPPAGAALVEALERGDSDVQRRAAAALTKIREPRAVAPLIARLRALQGSGLNDPAIDALALIGVPAVDELQALLRDDDLRIRRRAVWTLARIADPRLLETFLELLKDDDWEVRRKAAKTLVRWHERRVLEALIGALEDEHESVRRVAARVLELMSGAKGVGDDPDAWRRWLADRDEAE